jgi:hypothetical protein
MGIKKNTNALRGIKNKKSGEYFKVRILKAPPRHLYPLVGCWLYWCLWVTPIGCSVNDDYSIDN